ncbi:hypothetical protein EYF80_055805 [Liparis tanakae]|uniref:Uncharacterized protein n=1 Tax=Liparis tanakae TaxID=230148 RepID=A0A4Z2EZJ6_9TELE|nr:hypothetical protein EYF80_055805 [Liparis tanakae]
MRYRSPRRVKAGPAAADRASALHYHHSPSTAAPPHSKGLRRVERRLLLRWRLSTAGERERR